MASLRHRDDGGVVMLIGLSVLPLILALGLVVDTGVAYNAQSRLQASLDSAVLAGAKKLGASVADMKTEARMFFDANYPNDYLGGQVLEFDAEFDDDKRELKVEATVEVPTAFMRIVGIDTVEISVDASAQQHLAGVELALVLDMTGSMNWSDPSGGTKLEALRNATDIMLDVIYGEEETVENVRVSVVPYNSLVNVGNQRTDWLQGFDEDDYDPHDWKGCVEARGGTRDRDDTPLSTEPLTAMLWPPVNSLFNYYNDPNAYCPDAEVLPLTEEKSTIVDHIDGLSARGATLTTVGFVWGWRTISPHWGSSWGLSESPVNYGDKAIKKAIVFMTDGITVIHSGNRYYNAYGFTEEGRLGTTGPGLATIEANDRLLESCSLAKEEGVEVFTVMYDLNNAAIEQLYRACASSTTHFFDAPDGPRLEAAFENIAGRLVALHLSE
jgi:Flp pilus assembly protein TadG